MKRQFRNCRIFYFFYTSANVVICRVKETVTIYAFVCAHTHISRTDVVRLYSYGSHINIRARIVFALLEVVSAALGERNVKLLKIE